jgi:hypothetical protein
MNEPREYKEQEENCRLHGGEEALTPSAARTADGVSTAL